MPDFFVPKKLASEKAMRLWKKGKSAAAPLVGCKKNAALAEKSPVWGARTAPVKVKFLVSFLSTFICGSRAHGFPAAAICGIAAAASEVGLTGANTIQSCPTVTEVFSQSSRAFA